MCTIRFKTFNKPFVVYFKYRSSPRYSDIQDQAGGVGADRNARAGAVWSGPALFASPVVTC